MEYYKTGGNEESALEIERPQLKLDDLINRLQLTPETENQSKIRYSIDEAAIDDEMKSKSEQALDLNDIESAERFFEGYPRMQPEPILRPPGESTVFTTAGVQRVESMLREHVEIKDQKFFVVQPVIRSQYMDSVREGTSTSFVDLSLEHVNAKTEDFLKIYKLLLTLIINQGVPLRDIQITMSESGDQWGKKNVTKNTIAFFIKNVEVSECIYIPDYPLGDTSQIAIVDGCFGLERFSWATGKHPYYYQDFERFYKTEDDRDKISGIIDPIRTGVLIACEGVEPSHKDPGYRLRQCMTRYFSRNIKTKLDTNELVAAAYKYWTRWGEQSSVDQTHISELMRKEIERAHNAAFLRKFKEYGGPDIYLDVNQDRHSFLRQIERSRPDQIDIIQKTRQEFL